MKCPKCGKKMKIVTYSCVNTDCDQNDIHVDEIEALENLDPEVSE